MKTQYNVFRKNNNGKSGADLVGTANTKKDADEMIEKDKIDFAEILSVNGISTIEDYTWSADKIDWS